MTHSRTIAHGFGRLHRQWRHMSVLFRSNFTHHLLPIAYINTGVRSTSSESPFAYVSCDIYLDQSSAA